MVLTRAGAEIVSVVVDDNGTTVVTTGCHNACGFAVQEIKGAVLCG